MVVRFPSAVENPPEIAETECPVCLGRMEVEQRDEIDWLVCPNGCPTEIEVPAPKPVEQEQHKTAVA